MANLVDFGVGMAISRQAAHCIGGGSQSPGSDFLDFGEGWSGVATLRLAAKTINNWSILLAAIISVLLFEFLFPHTKLLEYQSMSQNRLNWYIMAVGTLVIMQGAVDFMLLNGIGKLYLARFINACYFLANGVLVLCAAFLGSGLLGMACMYLVTAVGYRLVLGMATRSSMAEVFQHTVCCPNPSKLIFPLLRIAAPLGLVNTGSYLVSSVQVPLLGTILGPAIVAPFYLAQKMGAFLTQAALQPLHPQLPIFTRLLGGGNSTEARSVMRKSIAFSSISVVLANVVFYLMSPFFARVLSGSSEYVNPPTLALMALDYLILGVSVTFGFFVLASGKNPFTWSTLLAGSLNLVLLILLTPRIGIIAIPIASLAAGLLTNYWLNPVEGWKLLIRLGRV